MGRALEPETANDGSESAWPFAPGEGPARVQVGPSAAPKRLDGGGRASKVGNVGPRRANGYQADWAPLKAKTGGVMVFEARRDA